MEKRDILPHVTVHVTTHVTVPLQGFTPYFHMLPSLTTTSKRNIYIFFQISIEICNP